MDTKYLHTCLNTLKVISIIILIALFSFALVSCTDSSPGELEAEIVGQWQYDFPQKYDPEILFYDSPAVTSATINGKEYLILSFEPSRGPNNSRIFIFDTENPLSPRLTSTIAREQMDRESFMVESAAVQDGILYCSLFHDEGLWMVDISDPTQPRDMGIAPIEIAKNLIVTGDIAYASGQMYKGVSVSDISDPQSVGEIARIELPSRECYLAVSGEINGKEYMFVAVGTQNSDVQAPPGILVLDIKDPTKPVRVAYLQAQEGTRYMLDMALSGTVLYVAADEYLWLVDVSDPGNPLELARYSGIDCRSLVVSGPYAYVNERNQKKTTLDVSDPSSPRVLGSLDLVSKSRTLLYLSSGRLMALASGELYTIDISTPESPRIIDSHAFNMPDGTPGHIAGVAFEGNYACISLRGDETIGVSIMDAGGAAGLTELAFVEIEEQMFFGPLFLEGDRVYVFATPKFAAGGEKVFDSPI